MKSKKRKEMYMADARNLYLGHNATYIPLTCVGVSHWGFRVFRYQHFLRWGSKPTQRPNANVFVSQWNIGFRVSNINKGESEC